MRRGIEFTVGLGLLLGPLGYALTLEPEVVEPEIVEPEIVEVVEIVEVAAPQQVVATPGIAVDPTIPAVQAPAVPTTPAPIVEATPDDGDRLRFAFVNGAGLVLTTAAERAWGHGRLREHAGPGQFRAAKSADVAKLPAAHVAQRGRTFDVYGPDGEVCTARLGELAVLAQHDGPSLFDVFHGNREEQEWDPEQGEDPYEVFEREVHSDKEIRAKVWASLGHEGNQPWLVAPLVSDTSCEGGLWARDAELPAPTLLHLAAAPTPITAQRLAAFETSTELADTKARYAEWERELTDDQREELRSWDEIAVDHPATVREWHDLAGAARIVELEFGEASEGCGDYGNTSITALDLVTERGFEATSHSTGPLAVFDADLDGKFELLYDTTLVSETGALNGDTSRFEVFYCPC